MRANVAAIIPAKGDSNRLPRKNHSKIHGKSLVQWAVDYALKWTCVDHVILATDSSEIILSVHDKVDDVVRLNPSQISSEHLVDIYRDVAKICELDRKIGITHVVGLQPDHPDRHANLDEMVHYAIESRYDDLVTVADEDGLVRSGATRVMTLSALLCGRISDRIGVFEDPATNIHTPEDLDRAVGAFTECGGEMPCEKE
jgi:CMP-N-acetylneuraminic acid synthetase